MDTLSIRLIRFVSYALIPADFVQNIQTIALDVISAHQHLTITQH